MFLLARVLGALVIVVCMSTPTVAKRHGNATQVIFKLLYGAFLIWKLLKTPIEKCFHFKKITLE